MSLTMCQLVGAFPMPDGVFAHHAELSFKLQGNSTEGQNVLLDGSEVRFVLTPSGEMPAGAALWCNAAGAQDTTYLMTLKWTEIRNGRAQTQERVMNTVFIGLMSMMPVARLLNQADGIDHWQIEYLIGRPDEAFWVDGFEVMETWTPEALFDATSPQGFMVEGFKADDVWNPTHLQDNPANGFSVNGFMPT